jgi:hypothetical protein
MNITNQLVGDRLSNDSVYRISAELSATDSESLVWFDRDTKPPFKIWCLDDRNSNNPSAEINGIAMSFE